MFVDACARFYTTTPRTRRDLRGSRIRAMSAPRVAIGSGRSRSMPRPTGCCATGRSSRSRRRSSTCCCTSSRASRRWSAKDELFTALWPDVAVTDNALTQAVSELRQALGDDPSKPTYIQTVARRGYRFIAQSNRSSPASDRARSVTARRRAGDRPRAADDRRARLRQRQQRPGPGVAVVRDRRNRHERPPRRRVAAHHRPRAGRRSRAAGRQPTCRRCAETCTSISPSSAASSARANGCGSRRGSWTRRPARRCPTQRRTARSRTCSSCRTGSSRSSATRSGRRRRGSRGRTTTRETSSLEAYQAFTEGRVRLESLDATLVPGAIADFERAVALDGRYALAHVGLANARFWQYEMSRARNQPDAALLARAIDHVRRAIELERDLAEAHATLAFLLVSARTRPARRWRRRAAPSRSSRRTGATSSGWRTPRGATSGCGRWRTRWSSIRISRSRISRRRWCTSRAARSTAPSRCCARARSSRIGRRTCGSAIPAKGLHWLLGLVRLARGDAAEARVEFEREIAIGPSQLYAAEFAMNAYDGAGFAALRDRPAAEAARHVPAGRWSSSRSTRVRSSGSARRWLPTATGRRPPTRLPARRAAIDALRRGGRASEATLAEAFLHSVNGRPSRRIARPPRARCSPTGLPFTGWTIPIEPLFEPLRELPGIPQRSSPPSPTAPADFSLLHAPLTTPQHPAAYSRRP